ncbi:unnamed protein product [Caenorhabditis bovis]|uniref:(3R)-3-hydroxyacyl-CoA dehydrogenase n=1 Tax=Caenorhabditis bovis TaxID=2654633 RepID=A0A8S1EEG9_9PELO|nr:unnamed protein product [Caenorhabditis bovis]
MLLKSGLAIVTGGGSGIGKAICEKFAANGARIIVADLKKETAEKTIDGLEGTGHVAVGVDVSKIDSVRELENFVKSLDATPNVLVNCAGITKDKTLLKMPLKNWQDVIDVNLTSIFLMSQAFSKLAVERDAQLSIINISSIVGKIGNYGQTNYAATKSGVIGFTKSAARELAAKKIRVNAVLPGFTTSPMTKLVPKEVLDSIINQIPAHRMAEPHEIADAALFLASDMSSYVTGATIEVTGGYGM